MDRYSVEPKSRKDLRRLAKEIRKKFGLDKEVYFPVVQLLEALPSVYKDFNYEIVEDSDLSKKTHALTDINEKVIKIKESVYDAACEGSGRDRMTIMHEICHYITLCQLNFTLARSFEQDEIPVFCDPEWQAKCLAGEIMMPADKIYDMNPDEVSEKCGVSWPAAVFQLSKI